MANLTHAQFRWLQSVAKTGSADKPSGNRAAARASAAWVRNAEACQSLGLVTADRAFDSVQLTDAGRALVHADYASLRAVSYPEGSR